MFTAIPLPPQPVSPFTKIQTKDLLTGGAYGAFFLVAVFAFRRDSDRFTNLLLGASVLFIGLFEGRMVTIVDSILLVPPALPPALTHILWYTLYAGVLVATLALGRLYCGYLCPFGALTALLNKAFPFKRRLPSRIHNRLVYLKYIVLVFVFVEVVSGAFWAAGLEPFTPVFLFKGDWWIVILAVAFVAVSVVFERFYCKYLCPAGAAMALVSQIRVFEIRRWDECRRCRICDRSCPEGAIVNGRISPRECLNCRVCEVNYLDEGICPHYAAERAQRRVATA
jgi:polyferredoxin